MKPHFQFFFSPEIWATYPVLSLASSPSTIYILQPGSWLHWKRISFPPVSDGMFLISIWDLSRITLNIHISKFFQSLPITQLQSSSRVFGHSHSSTPLLRIKICLSSGCQNKEPQTWWLINHMFISHSSEGQKSKIRCQHAWVLIGVLFLACRGPPTHCVLYGGKRAGKLSTVSTYKGTNPLMEAPPYGRM